MKKLALIIVVVFAFTILQNCITTKRALELIENQKVDNFVKVVETLNKQNETLSQQNEDLTQQVITLKQRCDNLAVSLSQMNNMISIEAMLADGTVIYKRVNWILENNNYSQLRRVITEMPDSLAVE